MREFDRALRFGVAVEAVLWLLPAFVFLLFYVLQFGASFSVVLSHLLVIFSFWLGFFSLRLIGWRFFGAVRGWQRSISSAFMVVPPLLLVCWYCVTWGGLFFWGRVATWALVKVYFLQWEVLAVVGVPVWFVPFVVFLLIFLYFCLLHFFSGFDLARLVVNEFSSLGFGLLCLLGLLVFGFQITRLYDGVDLHPQEPIGISFFNHASLFQNHNLSVPPMIDSAENIERASYEEVRGVHRRNVVLIVGDALRADHMSIYGYKRHTTPYLQQSAVSHQTLLVPRARAVCAESSCGLMSIASSRPLHMFPSKPFTLYEVLRRYGYKVNMILSGDHTNFYGLKEAYGEVDEFFDGTRQKKRYINDDRLVLDFVEGLPSFDGGQPSMFQFHLMSSHGLGLRYYSKDTFGPLVNYYRWPSSDGLRAPSEEERVKAVNYYDAGVLQFDFVVERVLFSLEEKGYLKDAVVVIVGDHGEMLGEKDIFSHQRRVYEEVLNVPLVIQRRGYRGKGLGAWRLASQMDVAPTILAELGMAPPKVWQGVSLQAASRPRDLFFQQSPLVGFYSLDKGGGIIKYWNDTTSGRDFVYDVSADFSESNNMASAIEKSKLAKWRSEALKSVIFKAKPEAGNAIH